MVKSLYVKGFLKYASVLMMLEVGGTELSHPFV